MIELLVVMTVIIVLASMGMVQYRNSVVRAVRRSSRRTCSDARRHRPVLRRQDQQSLVARRAGERGYLREIPTDPITGSKDTWQPVNAEANVNDASAQTGIYDVKSGSEETALDGTQYRDWD